MKGKFGLNLMFRQANIGQNKLKTAKAPEPATGSSLYSKKV
jgi:hypothetical protein